MTDAGGLLSLHFPANMVLQLYIIFLFLKMHLGSSSSSSPRSVIFQILPPNSCSPSVPCPVSSQALLAGVFTHCNVLMANVGSSLNLTNLIEENLRQK